MESRHHPLFLSIPLGRWLGVEVRVSVFFALLAVTLCVQFGLHLGLLLTSILFVSILLHEFGHVFGARRTGGYGDEILMTPFGGLAFVRSGPRFLSEMMTTAAGPIVNLLLCLAPMPYLWRHGVVEGPVTLGIRDALYLFEIPFSEMPRDLLGGTLLLTVSLNWKLFWLNMLPVYPLDGGRMLRSIMARRMDAETAKFVSLRIGIIFGVVLAFGGLMFDEIWPVTLGFLGIILCMQEYYVSQITERYDDSFMGYDFSQGYTSLEKSTATERSRPPGFFARRRQKRAEERRQREQQERLAAAARLDELLDKVHQHGMDSLSAAEKRFLREASTRYKSPDKPQA